MIMTFGVCYHTAKSILDELETIKFSLGQTKIKRVAIIQFGVNNNNNSLVLDARKQTNIMRETFEENRMVDNIESCRKFHQCDVVILDAVSKSR